VALRRDDVQRVLDTYVRAWETQDPDLIVTIFTEDATYHERVLADPIPDRAAIYRYWEDKVVGAQANIRCTVLEYRIIGNTVYVEWEAFFDDLAKRQKKRMKEIAVLTFRDGLVCALREYWASESLGSLDGGENGHPLAGVATAAHSPGARLLSGTQV
jgi:hypothetical protein